MAGMAPAQNPRVVPLRGTAVAERPRLELVELTPWTTIVWDDPVNLMSYVTHVFTTYFGYPRTRAEQLMMQVHHEGRAIVSSGDREHMERDVAAMHAYGLWATLEKAE